MRAAEVIRTVVIDPGHGGKDPGAVYGVHKEKDIVLDVGKRLGKLITEQYPGVKVVYTRSTDVFVELVERGRIANKAGADLFISIHVNSTKSGAASGTETFVMGTTKGAANLEVAMRENDVIRFEEDPLSKYQGYQPGSSESLIMFNLMQYSHREQSMALATAVQQQYKGTVRLPDRGVKEAGFLVLWRTAMPAILTELGFINNAQDIKILSTPAGCDRYARCLFNAFSAYKAKTEGAGNRIVLDYSDEQSETKGPAAVVEAPVSQAASTPAASEPVRVEQPNPAADPVVVPLADIPAAGQIVFAVQVRTSPKHLPAGDPCFGVYRGKVSEVKVGNTYKYYVGECASYKQAAATQTEVRKHIKDAFVVAFRDGKPIPVSEAVKLTK
ncbi:MAG: N-acetylmuramoyl-L-alanine amidase [Rikenellaceae bacterium]|nr:N-acetylmuramoyl-L-alanine amidase [Rikenellaceae bacterium]